MSKTATAFKHILLTPEKTETAAPTNINSNKYDIVTITKLKSSAPELIKVHKIDNIQKIHKQVQKQVNNENTKNALDSMSNIYSTKSSSYKTATTTTTNTTEKKERILVRRHNPFDLKSISKLSFANSTDTYIESQNLIENSTIKQNILGSMSSYGNFVSNPLTSNQNLIDPNYYQNLLGVKSRTIYILSNEPNFKFENPRKSKIDHFKNENKTSEADFSSVDKRESKNESPSLAINRNDKTITDMPETKPTNLVDAESQFKKANLSDIDNKDAVRDQSSNASNMNQMTPTTQLNKNMFLNYRPTNQNSSSSSINVENVNLNVNQVDKSSNNNNNINNTKKLSRKNSLVNNQNEKKSIASGNNKNKNIEKETINNINTNILRHNPERYLDKYTILRIEKWIKEVNAQTFTN